jgi:hypothetical protein
LWSGYSSAKSLSRGSKLGSTRVELATSLMVRESSAPPRS